MYKFTKTVIMALMAMTIITISGVFLNSCQKDGVLDTTKQERVDVGKELKFPRIDFFILPNGQVYPANSNTFHLLEYYGGYYWYYDANGVKHWYWSQTGKPYSHPGFGSNSNTPPPPPSVPSIGKWVQNTLIDIMLAPIDNRQALVIANMNESYNPCISLSAKIREDLLEKVKLGEYIISDITETVTGNEDLLKFNYSIHFSNLKDGVTEEFPVLFIFEKSVN